MYLKKELYELIKTDESLFDFIQEGSLDGLWYWDLENPENEWMNARFWKVLGYNPDEMPHKSSAWQSIINQDDLKVAKENIVKHCENANHPYDQIVRYTHRDGSTKWIRCRGIAIRDANGKPIRMLGAHQDVTEIKNSELALLKTKIVAEESEEKYRALYDNAPLSYQSLDEDGCFIDVNPMWLKTLGYEREEVIGQWYGDFLHPDFVDHFRINFPEFKKRGCISDVQFKLRRKDNTYIYVSFEGCVGYTPEGKFKQTYCVFKDISEQKALENALIKAKNIAEESEKLFKSVIENAPDGVVIINEQGRFKYVSPSAMRLFGYNINESIGHSGDEYTHPDDLPMVLKTMETILVDPEQKPKLAYRFKRKSGEFRWIETTFSNLLSDKAINGIVLNFTDITERKQLIEELLLAKEKAEENERKLRNALENSPIPTAIAGADGTIIYLNKQFIETYGYTMQDIPLVEKWYERAYPDPHYRKVTLEDWNSEVEQSIKKGTPTRVKEYQVTCKNGDIKTVAVSGYFEKEIIVGLFQDITERKQAEQAIFELKEFNESIVTNLTEGIILENDKGIIQFANPAMLRMLGYNEGELVGENWKCFVPDDQIEVVSNANKRREKGESDQYEMELRRKDGERIFVLVGGVPNINKGRYVGLLAAFTDITERKQAEEALRLSESRYRKAQEIGRVGNWEYSLHNSHYWGSDEAKRIYGFDLKSEDFTTEEVENCIPDRKTVHRALIDLIEKEKPYDLEFEIITKDAGESRFIHSQAILEKDENGNPLKITGVIHDITERKHVEQLLQEKSEKIAAQNEEMAVQNEELNQINLELLESKQKAEENEERFNLAMQASNDGIFDWNLLTNDIYYSPAWKKMLGYEEHELPNDFSVWEKTTDPEDVKKSWELQQKLINKQIDRFVIEFKMKHKAGHWIDVLAQAEAVFNDKGKAVRIVGTHTDITKRKQAERALKDSEQRFRSLVNTLNSGVAFYKVINQGMSGRDYIIQSFNDFALKHENLKEKDVFGKSLKDIRPEIDDYGLVDVLREVWRTGKPALFPAKLYIDHKYANYYENRVFKISTGEIVAVYDDVTERERAHVALKEALEKAQESDRLKSAFLANMSHEIRTPMNGILGFADLLKKPDLTSDQQKKYIGIIEKSGARMLNIINNIVDISKIEAGLMEVTMKDTNINEQIEYTYTFFKPEVEAKGVRLTFKTGLPDKAAIIQTDREKVYAILTNLVKNAIKYTREGSIELGYDVVGSRQASALQFYVKDTGIGIPEDRQSAIFERFIQADIDDRMAYQGAGLGLAITKAYVEMLGGKIWVESCPEGKAGSHGSCFYFTLPYKTGTTSETMHTQDASSGGSTEVKKLKILITEDEEVSQILIDNYIKTFGKEILTAKTGLEAVEICRANPDIDLILMDIRMPHMDGYQATKQIREFNPEVIIIAQTAYSLTGDREKSIDAGCNDYITKPINKMVLQALIRKYFEN